MHHGYRAYPYAAGTSLFSADPANQALVPNVNVFKSDNRSSYNALMIHLQGNVSRRFNLVANYTLSRAQTGAACWANSLITSTASAIR